ncbi:MAG: type VI secretion system tip protein VgrG, partial [Acidobacteria bacterium]|nr:type VI secretion system tip protein VgrG [Acidobacteriota bacterium]
ADSPSLVTFTLKVAGAAVPSDVQVEAVDVWWDLNRVPRARLSLIDGDPAAGTFSLAEEGLFEPGKELSVAAGYDGGAETVLFSGVLAKQGLEITRSGISRLTVEAADRALGMTLARRNGVFEDLKDSQLIDKLLSRNGLSGTVSATKVVHEEIVQYYATDWDLMMTRAEMNGLVVKVQAGKVEVTPPDTSSSPVLTLTYGDSILDLSTEMDAATQLDKSAIRSTTWDPAEQKVVEAGASAVSVTEPGKPSSEDLAKVFGVKDFLQQSGGQLVPGDLSEWSTAELVKSRLSKVRGRVRFLGSPLAEPGKTVALGGLGASFNGKAYVSGVHHEIRDGSWKTTVEVGLSIRWFAAEAPHLAAPEASGQLPPISGLQTGIVREVAKDPGGEFRVRVTLPLLESGSAGVWARLACFYASKEVGAFFYPEKGDEVILAFMNEDPRYPVILGSVFSKKLPPPLAPEAANPKKVVKTRSGLQISFDDEAKILRLATPGGQVAVLDDQAA